MERSKVGIVIPAFNEAATIAEVVSKAIPHGVAIVIDDASIDMTGELAEIAGAKVIKVTNNIGYDEALNLGFSFANKIGCKFVITLDADGQHDMACIESFITAFLSGSSLVLGVRDQLPRLSERIFSWITLVRWKINDPLCGMKGYSIELYRSQGYFDSFGSIGTELMQFAINNNYNISQIPVLTHKREGSSRFGGALLANYRILRALIYLFKKRSTLLKS